MVVVEDMAAEEPQHARARGNGASSMGRSELQFESQRGRRWSGGADALGQARARNEGASMMGCSEFTPIESPRGWRENGAAEEVQHAGAHGDEAPMTGYPEFVLMSWRGKSWHGGAAAPRGTCARVIVLMSDGWEWYTERILSSNSLPRGMATCMSSVERIHRSRSCSSTEHGCTESSMVQFMYWAWSQMSSRRGALLK